METFVEFKLNKAADGFTDVVEALEKNTGDARDTLGQLTTYLELHGNRPTSNSRLWYSHHQGHLQTSASH
jgi:hypothetical protein